MQNNNPKSKIRLSSQLQPQFLALFIEKVGQGSFKECQSSQFQQIESNQKMQDFYLEQQQQIVKSSIKTAEFNKFINFGYQKIINSNPDEIYDLSISKYNFVYGFNEGSKTVQIIDGQICRAVGLNIFMSGRIYPNFDDRSSGNIHNFEIKYLKYNKKNHILYSSSQGKYGQIILWKYNIDNNENKLDFIKKLILPSSSQSSIFIFNNDNNNNQILSITKCSLHKSSQLYSFDYETGKRIKYPIILGKVMNICKQQKIYLINQQGLNQLIFLEHSYQLIKIYSSKQFISYLQYLPDGHLVLGTIQGNIHIIDPSSKKIINTISLSGSVIIAIKYIKNNLMLASTSQKQLFLFQFQIFSILQSFYLCDLVKNILLNNNKIYCCLKNGKIEQFTLNQNKIIKITNQIDDNLVYRKSKKCLQHLTYNKIADKYFYHYSQSQFINIFEIKQDIICKLNKIELSHPAIIIDTNGIILGSVCLQNQLDNTKQSKHILELFDFTRQKTISTTKLPYDCTCIKFNQDGDKLALGFQNGKIIIINVNNSKTPIIICESQQQKISNYNHLNKIQNIFWSKDNKLLKTISHQNLLFYYLINKNQSYQINIFDNKKTPEKQSIKTLLLNARWQSMGKFNWRTSKIWSKATQIDQYYHIQQTPRYLFACTSEGVMKIYNNPAIQDKFHHICRWFLGPFRCMQLKDKVLSKSLLIQANGIIFSFNLDLDS